VHRGRLFVSSSEFVFFGIDQPSAATIAALFR
jgi:hypothetical protein